MSQLMRPSWCTTLPEPGQVRGELYAGRDGIDSAVPKIGLLSDSHGRAHTTRQAVDLLIEQGAQVLIHLGDVGGIDVIDALVTASPENERQIEAHLVFGNMDVDAVSLERYARDLGVCVDHPVGRLDLRKGQLVFLHGDDLNALRRVVAEGVRYVCHGHSHIASDRRDGPTRVINPGALFRAEDYTVALIDTDTDALRFHVLKRS